LPGGLIEDPEMMGVDSRDMINTKASLLIPVENQVRELDAKLLLACVAAKRGLASIIGPKRLVESRAASYPRSIYLSKSILHGHRKFLLLACKLGHKIVAWDEDALVHLPPDIYFSRRLSPVSLGCVSHLFAWGEDNADLWRQYPELPEGIPIHITGNPRGDLLRPEMQGFYQAAVEKLRKTYGDYILINTNFNHVNAYTPDRNLFHPGKRAGGTPAFGRAARGMPREYAEGLRDHKQATFEHFQKIIPALEKAFPEHNIVVRPHQVENQDVYHHIAASCPKVHVINKGYVVPWLKAAKVLIHNGCTTSVEAFAMGVPVVSYRAAVNKVYDDGFYRLPNGLSHHCFNFAELEDTLRKILNDELVDDQGDERRALFTRYLAAQKGALACERMVDVLARAAVDLDNSSKPPLWDRLTSWYKITKRRIRKPSILDDSNAHASLAYQRRKHPDVLLDDLHSRIKRFQQLLGHKDSIGVEQIYPQIFRISA
jgi:surface carbohydrate biosynthesis protein